METLVCSLMFLDIRPADWISIFTGNISSANRIFRLEKVIRSADRTFSLEIVILSPDQIFN